MNTIDKLVEALEETTALLERIVDGKEWGAIEEYIDQAREALAQARAEQAEPVAVAFLDIGAGGYVDLGSDLTYGQLAELPFGRHALAIVGTFGVDGYAPTTPPAAPNPSSTDWIAVAKLEPLNDREIQDVIDESHKTFRAWSRGIRGQMFMPQDDVKWHLIRAVEAAHNAKLKG